MSQPWTVGDHVAGRYRLIATVGRGGFGVVWKAADTAHDDDLVAIKVLIRREGVTDDDFDGERKRFLLEARETHRLNGGPHIVSILDWGEHGERPFIVMPFIDGHTLGALLHPPEGGPLDPVRAVRVVGQIADALEWAHDHGRVHRDVKPSNVMVRSVGERSKDHVTVLDFGIVGAIGSAAWTLVTPTGAVLGSYAYLAPERIPFGPDPGSRREPDERFDVYGLSCVLYECLTGRLAFDAPGLDVLGQQRWAPRPRPSQVDPSLIAFDDVVVRGLAVAVEERTRYAHEFKDMMTAALAVWTAEQPPKPPTPAKPPKPPSGWGAQRPKPPKPPKPPPPGSTDTTRPQEPALVGGAVAGIAGGAAGVVLDLGVTGSVGLIAAAWLAGTAAGLAYWRARRGRRAGAPPPR